MWLSWEWRRALTTVLAVWLLLSLWKSRLQLSITPSRAVPFHSGMQMVEDVRQGGSPSSARWSADAPTSNHDSAGALPRERPRSWSRFAPDNASHPLAPMAASCTRCEPFCAATHAEFHCPLRKCCGCSFCHTTTSSAEPEPQRQPAEARAAQRPPPPPLPPPASSSGAAAADAAAATGSASSDGEHSVTVSTRSSPPAGAGGAGGHRHSVALGVLTESRESARFKAMESMRLTNPDPSTSPHPHPKTLALTLTTQPSA